MKDIEKTDQQTNHALSCSITEAIDQPAVPFRDSDSPDSAVWQITFDAIDEMIFVMDRERRIVRANRAFKEAMSILELKCTRCFELVHQTSGPPAWCKTNQVFSTGLPQRWEICDEGTPLRWFELSVSPVKDSLGQVVQVVHLMVDITLKKKAELALQQSEELTRRFLNAVPHGVFILDREGKPHYANDRSKEILGKGIIEDTSTSQLGDVYQAYLAGTEDPYPADEMPVVRALGGESSTIDDMIIERPEGTIPLEVTGAPVTDEYGRTTHAMAVFQDISRRRELERQLVHAQKMESIGQLAAGIAHEINTPVQYVSDNTEFLKLAFSRVMKVVDTLRGLCHAAEEGEEDPNRFKTARKALKKNKIEYLTKEVPRAIEQSLEGLEHIAEIVGAMKEFSHPSPSEKELVNLNHIIETTLTVARNEWKYVADSKLELDPALPSIPGLRNELSQVILNLIVNASHAIGDMVEDTGNKGMIQISTRKLDDWAEIRISDTGTGIPEEHMEKVFDPFFTTKKVGKGTGQGLAISHSIIVDKHDGRIRVESTVGQGTTFTIHLPYAEPSADDGVIG